MRSITPTELENRLASGEEPPILLDVRDPREFAHARIEGSLNIPLNTLPARLHELERSHETIVICHHGMRSAMAIQYLETQGFSSVINLTGGIDAWALQVDPATPRY